MRITAIVILATLLTGCGDAYWVGNESFSTREQALQRQQEVNARQVASVAPTTRPVGGSAIVAIPSAARIEQSGIKSHGRLPKDAMAYLVTSSANNVRMMADAVRKRAIFTRTDILSLDAPEKADAQGYDYLLYLDVQNPDLVTWYVKGRSLPAPRPVPMDSVPASSSDWLITWLKTLEKTVHTDTSEQIRN